MLEIIRGHVYLERNNKGYQFAMVWLQNIDFFDEM